MNDVSHSPLGKDTRYGGGYDPALLYPIPRAQNRAGIGITAPLPFVGCDVWTAWELSWLDARGKPQVAIARIRFDAASPCIIESKSLKLYLYGYASRRLASSAALIAQLEHDLGHASGAAVTVTLVLPDAFAGERILAPSGEIIDDIAVDIDHYGPPRAELLRHHAEQADETLVTRLMKSNCPVTGQPDWASVHIRYQGPRLDRAALLRYIVSFREHSEFHEHCVERIYVDLMRQCQPSRLDVYARYTRRGGLDINPWRSSRDADPPTTARAARQ
ncbi:MAG TPA: NADPH-dependent 7-cyano-7-deazaguanine reductase QueF [Rhodanobacteraceae bacterium]|nr:NADPH-dependent 7-cyano-7-deazaguanine reductase QueF [Rhodanobacteraceae bacterium]